MISILTLDSLFPFFFASLGREQEEEEKKDPGDWKIALEKMASAAGVETHSSRTRVPGI